MKRLWKSVFASLMLLGSGLVAAPAQALEADELRGNLIETIALYGRAGGAGSEETYRYEDLRVEAQDSDFRVTVRGLAVLIDPAAQSLLKAGDIAFTMAPDEDSGDPGLFRVFDLDLPSTMTVTRGADAPGLEIKIGSVRLDALWSFVHLTYLNLDTLIQDVAVLDLADNSRITLPEAAGEIRSLPKEGGLYDMTFDLRFKGLQSSEPGFDVRIAELDTLWETMDYDLVAMAEAFRKMAESETGEPVGHPQPVFALVAAPGSFSGSGGRMQMNARGLRFSDLEDGMTAELESLGLDFGLADLDQPLARADIFLNQRGWRLNGVAKGAGTLEAELLPQETTLKITVEKLPFRQIMAELGEMISSPETVKDFIEPQPEPESEAPVQPDTLVNPMGDEKIRQAFLEAGTTVSISGTKFRSAAAELELGGLFTVDPAAVFGVSGSFAGALFGLDRLIELAQAGVADPDPAIRGRALQAVGLLGILQAYAARGATDDGRPVDRFEVLVEPSGAVTVNGQPVVLLE